MAQAQYRTLSKRVLDRLSVNGKDAIFWDRDLAGFGIRVYPSGKKVFVVHTRAFGRSKRVTLGRYPELTPEAARKNATAVIARIKKGEPPVPPEPAPVPMVADLAERYHREYVEMHCKPATVVALPAHAAQAHRARSRGAAGCGRGTQGHPELP